MKIELCMGSIKIGKINGWTMDGLWMNRKNRRMWNCGGNQRINSPLDWWIMDEWMNLWIVGRMDG